MQAARVLFWPGAKHVGFVNEVLWHHNCCSSCEGVVFLHHVSRMCGNVAFVLSLLAAGDSKRKSGELRRS